MTREEPVMTEKYLIVRCQGCQEVWALDFEPDPCTCDVEDVSQIGTDLLFIEALDFREALTKFEATKFEAQAL